MPADLTPEERAAVARFEAELHTVADAYTGEQSPADNVDAVVAAVGANLRRVMLAMGFSEEDAQIAVGSVTAEVEGDSIAASYAVPEQVAAYLDAVKAGDIERAAIILRAREG